MILLFILLIVLIQPYKTVFARHSMTTTSFLVLYAMFYFAILGMTLAAVKDESFLGFCYFACAVLLFVLLICIFVLAFLWFYSRRKFGLVLFHHASAWRRGYRLLGDDGDLEGEEIGDRMVNLDVNRVNSPPAVVRKAINLTL